MVGGGRGRTPSLPVESGDPSLFTTDSPFHYLPLFFLLNSGTLCLPTKPEVVSHTLCILIHQTCSSCYSGF